MVVLVGGSVVDCLSALEEVVLLGELCADELGELIVCDELAVKLAELLCLILDELAELVKADVSAEVAAVDVVGMLAEFRVVELVMLAELIVLVELAELGTVERVAMLVERDEDVPLDVLVKLAGCVEDEMPEELVELDDEDVRLVVLAWLVERDDVELGEVVILLLTPAPAFVSPTCSANAFKNGAVGKSS
ncbi:hypothetical protein Slin15195_G061960 [Septoria linicola]|uniref:Uncharacterized protein n=1 Tax=Septoria linicola TaxID=215465 RepID=A0A9Q9EK48_9PEZI|nr:hypothetical protein Slin15195_G061960 [Septoria linicola]